MDRRAADGTAGSLTSELTQIKTTESNILHQLADLRYGCMAMVWTSCMAVQLWWFTFEAILLRLEHLIVQGRRK